MPESRLLGLLLDQDERYTIVFMLGYSTAGALSRYAYEGVGSAMETFVVLALATGAFAILFALINARRSEKSAWEVRS